MKISVDGIELFELTEMQKKVIKNDIPSQIFDADMKRRLEDRLLNKYRECFKRLKIEWELKLKDRVKSIPTDDNEFLELVFSQPDYKNRTEREIDIMIYDLRQITLAQLTRLMADNHLKEIPNNDIEFLELIVPMLDIKVFRGVNLYEFLELVKKTRGV